MAVNKNFVVKNGLEVATNAIVVDAVNKRVGIGSTIPGVELDVRGSFISTNSYTSGVSTVFNRLNVGAAGGVLSVLGVGGSVGVGTNLPGYLLEVHSTADTGQTALYVRGDSYVTGNLTVGGDINLDDINTDQIISNTISVAVAGTITRLDATTAGITSAYIANSTGTNLNYTGFATVTGNVQVTGITSSNSFQIGNTQVISSARQLQNIASMDATTVSTIETVIQNAPNIFTDLKISGITTLGVTSATDLSAKNLNISGISTLGSVPSINVTGITTLGTVKINTGIITATIGVVTYYGDGQYISNIVRGAGIGTYGTILGYGATVFDFRGSGIGTVTTGSGIGTVFIETIGSRVSISTVPPSNASSKVGDLWYSSILGRTFIYYDEIALGVGSSSFWIDAAPFNMSVLSSIDNIILSAKTPNAPSIGFTTDTSTGFFSPGLGQVTIVSTGSSILNVNSNGVNVTGVTTSSGGFSGNVVGALLGNVTGNVTGNVSGNVNGYINSPGISTIGNLQSTTINVTGVSTLGVITASQLNVSGSVGVGTTNALYKLTVSNNAAATSGLANAIADFTGSVNAYTQLNVRNSLSGTNASSDVVVTADTGTDTTNFLDLGINNSGFSTTTWTVNGPTDGYLYTSNTNLSVGVATTSAYLSLFAGGTLASNEKVRVTNSGVGIGTTNPSYTLDVFGNARVGINTSQGVILTSPNGTKYQLFVENNGTLKTIAV